MTADAATASPRRRAYLVLGVLWCVQLLNLVDRTVPYILAEPMKRELGLSDLQLGMLSGLGFSLIYSMVGLPLAWLADRTSRRWVLACAAGLWSLMTMLGGWSQNFLQLLLSRMGVAVGEAACQPVAHAMIADAFPQHRRGALIGIFTLTVPLAALTSSALGGWLNDHVGWRHTMMVIGAPGLALAAILLLTARDDRARSEKRVAVGAAGVARQMWKNRAFFHSAAGITVYMMGFSAYGAFAAPFLIRTQGMTVGNAGLWLGLMNGGAGFAGTLISLAMVDRLTRDRAGKVMAPVAIAIAATSPFFIAAWFAPTGLRSLALLIPWAVAANLLIVPTFTAAQNLAPPEARAFVSAMIYACIGILGVAVGPMLVGFISDALHPRFGADSLRYALCCMVVPQLWSLAHFARAATAKPQPQPA